MLRKKFTSAGWDLSLNIGHSPPQPQSQPTCYLKRRVGVETKGLPPGRGSASLFRDTKGLARRNRPRRLERRDHGSVSRAPILLDVRFWDKKIYPKRSMMYGIVNMDGSFSWAFHVCNILPVNMDGSFSWAFHVCNILPDPSTSSGQTKTCHTRWP